MRTSLNEMHQIEGYLLQTGSIEEGLLVEAGMSLSNDFSQKVSAQKSAYALIRSYGKAKLADEIKAVENELFKLPRYRGFKSAIVSLFTK